MAAGAPRIPVMLLDQLADRGRLVIPVGPRDGQRVDPPFAGFVHQPQARRHGQHQPVQAERKAERQ